MNRTFAWMLLSSLVVNTLFSGNAFCAPDEAIAPSSISIQSNMEGAALYIDGKDSGLVTPLNGPVTVEPGFHRLSLEKEDHTSWRKEILLTPGEAMALTAVLLPLNVTESQKEAFKDMGKKPITKRWWFWAIIIAGIGSAIAAEDADDGGTVLVTW